MKNPFGKNNFDRLEYASNFGKVQPEEEVIQAKVESKIQKLKAAKELLTKAEKEVIKLYVLPRTKQLQQLTSALNITTQVIASTKGLGLKQPLTKCVNELTSLREGVFTNAATDKKGLSILCLKEAQQAIAAHLEASESKVVMLAEQFDAEKYFQRIGTLLKNTDSEATKLQPLTTQPFVVARAPVIPADGFVNTDKLKKLGFNVDNLGGYPLMHNQLVLGINPKFALKDQAIKKSTNITKVLREEAEYLRKLIQKQQKVKLQFVSDVSFRVSGGSWFWLMTEQQLNQFAKAFPGGIKVNRWGFGFRESKGDND